MGTRRSVRRTLKSIFCFLCQIFSHPQSSIPWHYLSTREILYLHWLFIGFCEIGRNNNTELFPMEFTYVLGMKSKFIPPCLRKVLYKHCSYIPLRFVRAVIQSLYLRLFLW